MIFFFFCKKLFFLFSFPHTPSIYICELNEKYRVLTLACSISTMLKDKVAKDCFSIWIAVTNAWILTQNPNGGKSAKEDQEMVSEV